MSDAHCRYTLPGYALPPGVGGHCCWRPAWDGSERWAGSDRCIWHARVDGKPEAALESARTGGTTPLDHAYLRDATVPSIVSFAGCSLSGAEFSGSTYVGGSFREAVLVNARFAGASLARTDFTGADLEGADLEGADLEGADLEGADLEGADLSDADLSDADLADARLEGADLSGATAVAADLSGANLVDADLGGSDLRRATLDGVAATGADLAAASLRGAGLADAVLDDAVLSGTDLTAAELPRASLRDAALDGAVLVSADLAGADLQWADVSGANLDGAALSGVVLWRTDFTGASLARATLTAARTRPEHLRMDSRVTIRPSGISPTGEPVEVASQPIEIAGGDGATAVSFADATLAGADLSGTELYAPAFDGADLEDATLADATLRGATLRSTGLERANLTRTDLFDADLTGAAIYAATLAGTQINADTVFGSHYGDGSLGKAAWTHRNLERLFRMHALPTPARRHYVRQKDVLRRQYRQRGAWGKYLRAVVSSASTRYGESPLRVVLTSIGIILLCTALYPVLGGIVRSPATDGTTHALETLPIPVDPISGPGLVLFESFYFSVVTFTTMGDGDFRPASQAVQVLSVLEAFAGALLMALFVYVLGRRATW